MTCATEILNPVTIYGLFQGECCLYVGRTTNPTMRHATHRRTTLRNQLFEFRVLTVVELEDASAAEGNAIAEWKAKGMAKLNSEHLGQNAKAISARLPSGLNETVWMMADDFGIKASSLVRMALDFMTEAVSSGTHAFINGKLQAL